MFYRKDERDRRWRENQIAFAELAHHYPCCDVPTIEMCLKCNLPAAKPCKNKTAIDDALMEQGYNQCAECMHENFLPLQGA